MLGQLACGKLADRGERGEIEKSHLHLDTGGIRFQAGQGGFAALPVATGEDDVRAFASQLQCGVVADAAVGSGDEDTFACLGRDVGC